MTMEVVMVVNEVTDHSESESEVSNPTLGENIAKRHEGLTRENTGDGCG